MLPLFCSLFSKLDWCGNKLMTACVRLQYRKTIPSQRAGKCIVSTQTTVKPKEEEEEEEIRAYKLNSRMRHTTNCVHFALCACIGLWRSAARPKSSSARPVGSLFVVFVISLYMRPVYAAFVLLFQHFTHVVIACFADCVCLFAVCLCVQLSLPFIEVGGWWCFFCVCVCCAFVTTDEMETQV